MLTSIKLKQIQLDQLYDWVDSLQLSRPKKNISRDFSDASLMAETVANFYPKIVELHNYPSGNSFKVKITNWKTLNNKVLSKLGIHLTDEDCNRLAEAKPMAIEAILYEIKKMIDDTVLLNNMNRQDQQLPRHRNGSSLHSAENFYPQKSFSEDQVTNAKRLLSHHQSSRADQLKEILLLIKQKISIVEKSLERKDGQVRQLEQILKQSQRQ